VTVEVLIFGASAMQVGRDRVTVTIAEPVTAGRVLSALEAEHPELNVAGIAARLAVNHAFADGDTPITARDEVALIALVCGG